jgi:hypothetical protein
MFEVYMLQPVTAACELFAPRRHRSFVAEPRLDDLMRDPMTQALMAADRVDRCEFNALVAQVQASLR